MKARPTSKQCRHYLLEINRYLRIHDVPIPENAISEVKTAIQSAADNAKQTYFSDNATKSQRRVLKRYGYPTNITKAEASQVIDALTKNDWQPLSEPPRFKSLDSHLDKEYRSITNCGDRQQNE